MGFYHHLIELGMKETEAQVYLSCLRARHGLFVHEIVRQTDIRRSTIDLILQRLRKEGFISRYKEGARWMYLAEDPERIVFSLERKIESLKDGLHDLRSELEGSVSAATRVYEGVSGLNALYDDILLTNRILEDSAKFVLTISSGRDVLERLPDHGRSFVRKRVKHRISTKVLAPDTSLCRKIFAQNPERLRESRFFDVRAYHFETEINVYGDKVALINFQEPQIMGTVIHNRQIAQSHRSLFQMIWDQHEALAGE